MEILTDTRGYIQKMKRANETDPRAKNRHATVHTLGFCITLGRESRKHTPKIGCAQQREIPLVATRLFAR